MADNGSSSHHVTAFTAKDFSDHWNGGCEKTQLVSYFLQEYSSLYV